MNQKKKGNRGERQAKAFLQEWSGWAFERTPQSGGLRWKSSDNIAGDLICTEPNVIFPFAVEVKNHRDIDFSHLLRPELKTNQIKEFWNQALGDSIRASKIPILMMRYNGLPKEYFFVIFPAEFIKSYFAKTGKLPKPYIRTQKLFITTTEALFKTKFKTFTKLGLRWLKDQVNG